MSQQREGYYDYMLRRSREEDSRGRSDILEHTGYKKSDEFYMPFSELNFDYADFKILGNIHENPELLEEIEKV